jgi:flagellar protein FlaG
MNIGNVSRPAGTTTTDAGSEVRARPAGDPPAATGGSARPAAATTESQRAVRSRSESRAADRQADLSRDEVQKLVDRIGEQIRIERRSLSFTVNDELGKTIVTVIDRETDEVIRQIPSEELVRIAQAIKAINDQRAAAGDGGTGTGLLIQAKA